METRVVNLYKEKYDVYIGRPGKGQNGYFGNPYRIGEMCSRCGELHKTGGDTLKCYKEYFYERIENDQEFYNNVCNLYGKTLGCFCKPKPCHGDLIVEWLKHNDVSK